jgi:hypothetical protein
MILDSSITHETYVEDCEVCCNPIQLSVRFHNSELEGFEAVDIEQ